MAHKTAAQQTEQAVKAVISKMAQTPGGQELLIGPDDADDFAQLDSLVDELAGADDAGGFVTVSKIHPNQAKPSYCFRCAISDFSLDRIKNEYGGGNYSIRAYAINKATNGGRASCAYSRVHSIEAPVKPPDAPAGAGGPLTRADIENIIAARLPAAVDPNTALMNNVLLIKNIREAILPGGQAAAAPPPAPAQSPMAMLTEMMAGFAAMQKFAGNLLPAPAGEQSEVTVFGNLAGKALEVIQAGMANRGNDNALPPADGRTFQSPLLAANAGAQRRLDQANPPRAAPGGTIVKQTLDPLTVRGAHQPAGTVPPAPPQGTDDMMSLMLAVLAGKAARNANPQTCVDFLLDDVEASGQLDMFATMLEMPNWFDLLTESNPAIKPFQEWFTQLRNECLAALGPPPPAGAGEEKIIEAAGQVDAKAA